MTPRQTDVLNAITHLTLKAGYPPTVKEVAAQTGVSFQRVHQHLDALEQKGAIKRTHGSQRTIRVVEEVQD